MEALRLTASVQIADHIRNDIVTGALAFGSRLKLNQMSVRYGTGLMPIREALRQLQGEGLVVVTPNCGARVRDVDAEYVQNLFDLRIVVEALLARRAAQRIQPQQLMAVIAAEEAFERSGSREDVSALLDANRAFHRAINEAANNPEASLLLDRHHHLVTALWNRHGRDPRSFAAVVSDHQQMIRALEAHDADVAASLAMAHAAKAKLELVSRMCGSRMAQVA